MDIATIEMFNGQLSTAKEFLKSSEQILWDLAHYISDNAIAKIMMLKLHEEKEYSEKKVENFNFPELVNEFKSSFTNIKINYEFIEKQHSKGRNPFQHHLTTTYLGIRKPHAKLYLNQFEQLMVEINIYNPNPEFTLGLNIDEIIKEIKVTELDTNLPIDIIMLQIVEITNNEFVRHDLDIKIVIIPCDINKDLFPMDDEIKNLIRNCKRPISLNNFQPLFNSFKLKPRPNYYIYHSKDQDDGYDLIITTKGIIILHIYFNNTYVELYETKNRILSEQFSYREKELPFEKFIDTTECYFLFLKDLFQKINYIGKIDIWRDSILSFKKFWLYDGKSPKVRHFRPISINSNLNDIETDLKIKEILHSLYDDLFQAFEKIKAPIEEILIKNHNIKENYLEKIENLRNIEVLFNKGKINKKSLCPCGSGKKFKNCCLKKLKTKNSF